MTPQTFSVQVQRMQGRFGEKALGKEFIDLIWRECMTMSDGAFIRLADVFIGSRPHHKPPLLAEFREARLNEERVQFQRDLKSAVDAIERKPIPAILARIGYPGCKTAWEAVQVQIHRNKVARANGEEP